MKERLKDVGVRIKKIEGKNKGDGGNPKFLEVS